MARRLVVLFALVVAASTVSSRAASTTLAPADRARLERRETVVFEQTFERGGHRLIGGLTYAIVDADAATVSGLLTDVTAVEHILPKTKHARFLQPCPNGDRLLELVQGNALVEAHYTVRLRQEGQLARFWLEPSLHHTIDDVWGFFRAEPFDGPDGRPQVLLTYGVLVGLGGGMFPKAVEDRVRAALLSVPDRLRRHVRSLSPAAHL